LVDVKDMQIDTGASSKSAASVGDRVGLLGMFSALNERIVRGKAFDSRAACAVLIALLQAGPPSGPLPFDLYAVFSTMRTQAGRGALVAAHRLAPDAVISLGGSECDDLPRTPDDIDKQAVIRLGGGPVLALTDRLAVMDRPLFAHLTRTAHVAGLPFQMDANATVTEAGRIAITQPGAVTASLGIPVRYLGSPSALLDLADLDTAERLLWQALLTLTPDLLRP
jgi:endoglucanase